MSTSPPPVPPYQHPPYPRGKAVAIRRRVIWSLAGVSLVIVVVVSCALYRFYPRTTSLAQLHYGSCVDDAMKGAQALADGDGPEGLHVVPCFDAYDGHVFATSRVPDNVASDPAAVRQHAVEYCKHQRSTIPPDSEMVAFVPNPHDLANGDRAIVCVTVKAVPAHW